MQEGFDMSGALRARAEGYIDGLLDRPERALAYPPFHRFAYRAGYADGAKCRPDIKGISR